jgi:tRNA dimethylallyltransferase
VKWNGGLNVSSKPVLVITGPTGVGKTAISLALAKHFGGEIINADASQIYQKLNIGTAKITIDEMGGIPHHMMSFLKPGERFSIKSYQDETRRLLEVINRPILVGGSGLYIRSALSDYDLSTSASLQVDDSTLSNEELYQELVRLDSEAASKTHPNNRRRVLRYLEIAKERGRVLTKEATWLYPTLILCCERPRNILYQRINKRVLDMIQTGWIDEVQDLEAQGIPIKDIKEIGYRELASYLHGGASYEETISMIQQKTRHYAKRQMTFFRHQLPCYFIDLETTTLEEIINQVTSFYKSC